MKQPTRAARSPATLIRNGRFATRQYLMRYTRLTGATKRHPSPHHMPTRNAPTTKVIEATIATSRPPTSSGTPAIVYVLSEAVPDGTHTVENERAAGFWVSAGGTAATGCGAVAGGVSSTTGGGGSGALYVVAGAQSPYETLPRRSTDLQMLSIRGAAVAVTANATSPAMRTEAIRDARIATIRR